MPDIDIDFDTEHRDEVIEYIKDKYGHESVAQIVTFGKMKTKLAIRDIGRVLDIKLNLVDKLVKTLPDTIKSLETEIRNNKDFKEQLKHLPKSNQLIDFALKLENTVRHTGMHAAGVVIAPRKLPYFLPLYKAKGNIVTQFEKDEVEEIGLLKMDILGLKTLTILKKILKEIKEHEGVDLDLDNLPLDDRETYKVFQKGETDGIFQFESPGMRQFLKRSHPDKIEDLIVLNGLYRPGPLESGMAEIYIKRKRGEEKTDYLFPEMKEILKDTFGIIVFQEQVMKISQVISGFTMGKADEMRKIMGKKLEHKIKEVEVNFIKGGIKNKHNKKKLEDLFSQIKTFARYGFNKSHSAAYAHIAFQTAYLKAHYLTHFMCANLTNESTKPSTDSKIVQYISECKKAKIKILPPNINKSFTNFIPETKTAIRFGLRGLKNVGEAALLSIITERKKHGPYKDLSGFIKRIDLNKVNKAVLESLIKAGALDDFKFNRSVLFASVEYIISQAEAINKHKNQNQRSLFGEDNIFNRINIPEENLKLHEWSNEKIIQHEREISGIYLSYNPIEKYEYELKRICNTTINSLPEFNGEIARIGGVFTKIKELTAKKNNKKYGELFFEDLTGRIKILAFNNTWQTCREIIEIDKPFFLITTLKKSDKEAVLFLNEAIPFEEYLNKKAAGIVIKFPSHLIDNNFIANLKQAIHNNRASTPFRIYIQTPDNQQVVLNPSALSAGLSPTLIMKKEIEQITGNNTVEIVY
jgi:DNA polymerase-3 subunit alpha